MNCKQANAVPLSHILAYFSLFPSKKNARSAFYFALDRKERTPSLLVDFSSNTAFDFGTGKKYDVVSIVQVLNRCSVGDALDFIAKLGSVQPEFAFISKVPQREASVEKIHRISHPALSSYLARRMLLPVADEVSEVHYTDNDRNYFGVGFKNDSGGYEVSNGLKFKRCLGSKDITSFRGQHDVLRIFEGWADYLSFKVLARPESFKASDFIILNSVSLANRVINGCDRYRRVELYLDNDPAGDRTTGDFCQVLPNASDMRVLYSGHKDLNEFLVDNGILGK